MALAYRLVFWLCLVALGWGDGDAALLLQKLRDMDVLHHWRAGLERIDWRSGDPDPGQALHQKTSTHCSAFVASAGERLGIYILRPPQHKASFLASAQQDWLNSDEGRQAGWERLADAQAARDHANQGQFVVASWRNPVANKPGHIAIVIPSDWSDERLEREGCEIMQAGRSNYLSASLRQGFSNHPGAFENREIQFHAHATDF
ncbi:hypothetical protein JST97_01620 [bacterium]|nr:hypothetical protein [bacterium]